MRFGRRLNWLALLHPARRSLSGHQWVMKPLTPFCSRHLSLLPYKLGNCPSPKYLLSQFSVFVSIRRHELENRSQSNSGTHVNESSESTMIVRSSSRR